MTKSCCVYAQFSFSDFLEFSRIFKILNVTAKNGIIDSLMLNQF